MRNCGADKEAKGGINDTGHRGHAEMGRARGTSPVSQR